MTTSEKRKTLAYLLGVIVLTALIAAALPQLELKPGLPLPGQEDSSAGLPPIAVQPLPVISISEFWKAVLGILLTVGLVYNLYRLLKGSTWRWKDVLRSSLYMLVLITIFVGLLFILSRVRLTTEAAAVEIPLPIEAVKGPPLGPLPPGLIWIVLLGLGAAVVGLGLWLVFRPPDRPGLDPLKLEAERALHALKTGLDLKNVILRCYLQMAQVLKQEQGLEMDTAMTAREFERLLEIRGVPPVPVHQLTQLFEAARYGHRPPGPGDERQAVDCLTAIVRYSQAGKGPR